MCCVYADEGDAPPLLCGLSPWSAPHATTGCRFPTPGCGSTSTAFSARPLVRAAHARACLGAFLDWLESDTDGAPAIRWGTVSADGPFWRALAEALAESGRRSFVPYRFERAVMRPRAGSDAFLGRSLVAQGREGIAAPRAAARRSGQAGIRRAPGRRARPSNGSRISSELEARGWKGRNASALGSTDAGRLFFARATRAAARRGHLMMLGLRLAGRWIALKCNFLSGEGSFAVQDRLRRRLRQVLARHAARAGERAPVPRPARASLDGFLRRPDHFMINRLWLDRRGLADLVTTTGRAAGESHGFVAAAPALDVAHPAANARRSLRS